jgi:hypothetical protein
MRHARLLVLVIAVLASTASVALAGSRVVVRANLEYKPHEISISGDGDLWAQHLRWRSWGGKSAVAVGQAVEQERPSHVNYTYPTRVTVSGRTYCANLQRTVYRKITAQILGPSAGVFGGRTFTAVWSCTSLLRLTARDSSASAR